MHPRFDNSRGIKFKKRYCGLVSLALLHYLASFKPKNAYVPPCIATDYLKFTTPDNCHFVLWMNLKASRYCKLGKFDLGGGCKHVALRTLHVTHLRCSHPTQGYLRLRHQILS